MGMNFTRRQFVVAAVGAALAVREGLAQNAKLQNPFYAMDTSFNRPGLSVDQQLDLVRELGYTGVAWTLEPMDKLRANLDRIEQRGLKMFTIYCGASVSPAGEIKL